MSPDDQTLGPQSKTCPPEDWLADLLTGDLDESHRLGVEAHLQNCAPCRKRMKNLTASSDEMRTWEKLRRAWTDTQAETGENCPTCGEPLQGTRADDHAQTSDQTEMAADHFKETVILDTVNRMSRLERELPHIPGYVCESLIGRGGMGVVYRARQVALNRLVALKMIVTGRHATLQQLARFHIEAEALACLTHENIVQIYEFGEHESGPYLALEFIEGSSLEETLQHKTYTPRETARLCLLLARAMHLAHSRGVVHRDLKPANILMTKAGQPKITDFGLAKRLSENSQWTKTDAVMGTPYYMAPEQARGETHAVGPLADVYSLGTILYELLTGNPPFTGENMADLLSQICTEPPKPLRKQNQQIPKDLETICLRCLEKDAVKRYQTADDLADDLERFLDSRPILARSIGPVERIAKWIRRRPTVSALIGGLVALLIVIGVGGVVYNLQLRQERDRAEDNFQLATHAVDEILKDLDEETFLIEPHSEERRKELLHTALDFTKKLAEQKPENVAMQRSLGFCHRRLGDIHRLMGNHQAAQTAYREAIGLLRELRESNPDDLEVSLQLAAAHGFLGELQRQTSRISEARESFAIALELYEGLLNVNADLSEGQAESARVLNNLGILQKETAGAENDQEREARLNQARESLGKSISKLTALAEKDPANRHYAQQIAQGYINLGSVMRLQKALRKGRTPYRLAIAQLEDLRQRFPNMAEYQFELALAHNNFGNLLSDASQFDEAVQELRKAEYAFQKLVKAHPGIPQFRQQLANTYNSLAVVNYKLGSTAETRKAWVNALTELEELVSQAPNVPDYFGDVGMIRGNLGYLEMKENDSEAAIAHLEAAIPSLQDALHANIDHPDFSKVAKKVSRDLVKSYQSMGRLDQAFQKVESLLDRSPARLVDVWLAAVLLGEIAKTPPSQANTPLPEPSQTVRSLAQRILEQVNAENAFEGNQKSKPEFDALRKWLTDSPQEPLK